MTTREQILNAARARKTLRAAPALARQLREAAGLTQAEVGDVLGVTRVAVSRWERGLRVPRGALAARYLDLLRAAVDEVPP